MEHTQPYGKRITAGAILVAIGLLHQLVGTIAGLGLLGPLPGMQPSAPLLDIARDGVFSAVEPHPARVMVFWFLMAGFLLVFLGWLAHRMERATGGLPGAFGPLLAAFCVLGGVMIPLSGFWLGLAPAILAWRRRVPADRLVSVSPAQHRVPGTEPVGR